MSHSNQRLLTILFLAGGLLLIPLIAMQFTEEVNWSGGDFLIMGGLLLGTGLLIELVLRKVTQARNRLLLGLAILLAFLLIWAELAVGVFGSPFAGS